MTEQKRYSQYENAWNKSEKRVNTELKLAQGFNVADIYLNRTYLENFRQHQLFLQVAIY